MRTRLCVSLLAAVAAGLVLPTSAPAAGKAPQGKIEKPVRGKKYALTPQHGPWMVMVASFTPPPPGAKTDGLTPEQAADELVYELRSKGMPAYTYSTESKVEHVETFDRLGEPDTRVFAAQRGNVCVLAGNYPGPDDPMAMKSRDWIKTFKPVFLTGGESDRVGMVSLKNGGVFRETFDAKGNAEGPLVGAFFTTNPLLSADQVRDRNPERLSLLTRLNGAGDCSLLDNKGKFTVVIASFYGKSVTLGGKAGRTVDLAAPASDSLDVAGRDAWALAKYMRQLKYDAYVWHDEHKSVVTVGGFDRLDDPRIPEVIAFYSAKTKPHATTKEPVLTAEFVTLPLKPTASDPVRKKWIFDPQPRVMARNGKFWGPLQSGAEQ